MTTERTKKARRIRKAIQRGKSRTIENGGAVRVFDISALAVTAEALSAAWTERGIPTPPEYLTPAPWFAKCVETTDESTWAAGVLIMAEAHGVEDAWEDILRNRAALANNRFVGCAPIDIVHIMIEVKNSCGHPH
ncbi:hypothetical protein OVN20_05365 [Microcella daejeonensis]|uniref:hypothetical protein n=1 Tax=Microcella daejeonensis TaxID=2994971 RepID=UPI00226F9DCB|nr:hypothetical protein [Microcella daejeonensis]WAB84980.1 hypothetical protein OVN20_05365 [Microcella daejeonensis]